MVSNASSELVRDVALDGLEPTCANYMTWPQSRDVGGQVLAGNAAPSRGVRG